MATEKLPAKTVVTWTDVGGVKGRGRIICIEPIPPRNDDGSIRWDLVTYRLYVLQRSHGRTVRAGYRYKRAADLTVVSLPVTMTDDDAMTDDDGSELGGVDYCRTR